MTFFRFFLSLVIVFIYCNNLLGSMEEDKIYNGGPLPAAGEKVHLEQNTRHYFGFTARKASDDRSVEKLVIHFDFDK